MDQLLDEWASDWKLAGRAETTMRSYQYVIRPLLASHETLTLAIVKGWVADAGTIDIRRWRGRVARAFCRWATAEGVADYSWWLRIPLTTVPETPQPTVTPDEALAVIGRCANIRDKALISVMWSSGMRVGEVCRMRVEDLDLANGCVVVPQTKAGRPRTAPLDQRAVKALHRLLRQQRRTEGPLWIGPKGPLTTSGVHQMLRRLNAPTAHSWRRGWAVHSLRQGVSQVSVQYAAGWSSGAMVTRYARGLAMELSLSEFGQRWAG